MTHSTTLAATERTALQRLLDPRSIAIVGASTDPAKRGYQAIRALQESGYGYPVYPVNPNAAEILGLEVVSSIDRLPPGVDVALVAVPGAAVPRVLRECGAAGIAGAVVLANGFREIGAAGEPLEAELAAAIAESGVRVIGPNTSGLANVSAGANLVGLQGIPSGPVSVVTQSGNMLLSLVNDIDTVRGPGLHTYVGLGNQADVRYDECLTELAAQPSCGAVAVHSEGIVDGRAFLTAAARATAATPVVMLRGGRSAAGQRTALSHTGSVAGSDAVATAVLAQAGVELVQRSDELAVVAGALATTGPVLPGRRVAVLSDGGGHATLAVDALTARGIELADLSERTRAALRALLGPAASVVDPVDVAGATDSDPAVFAAAIEILTADPAVGLVLVVGLFGGYHRRFGAALEEIENYTVRRILDIRAAHGTPLVVQSCYAGAPIANHDTLRTSGVPVLASIDHAVRIVAALDRRRLRLETSGQRSPLTLPAPAAPGAPGAGVVDEPQGAARQPDHGVGVGALGFGVSAVGG
ncbi:CoA-binding protein, partial [Nocardia wallacei]|uniref:CoA-binding protein n=1 Tax=Nocardia wallacei TaxID=480035 RepID=UPI0024554591